MPRPTPKKVTIEFDGGVKAESSFDALPGPLQSAILRQPCAIVASSAGSADRT